MKWAIICLSALLFSCTGGTTASNIVPWVITAWPGRVFRPRRIKTRGRPSCIEDGLDERVRVCRMKKGDVRDWAFPQSLFQYYFLSIPPFFPLVCYHLLLLPLISFPYHPTPPPSPLPHTHWHHLLLLCVLVSECMDWNNCCEHCDCLTNVLSSPLWLSAMCANSSSNNFTTNHLFHSFLGLYT